VRIKNSGVVEEDVDSAERLDRRIDRVPAIFRNAHVGADKNRFAAFVPDALYDILSPLGIATGDGDTGSLAREQDCCCLADTTMPLPYRLAKPPAVSPPSRVNTCPVAKAASSDAR